ncbi:hypothetical protein ACS15_1170 [Ralstonia insidiosa]|uniref:Uncharacterized protein n=1 Tax=Ralstonia insidiosa TaxID=190721 RepID=A0AAC9BGW9_9RALS|nr:hypothetical protein ACS15_1170 [Ralstonia insidiosa]
MSVQPRRHCRQRSAPRGRSARIGQEPRSLLPPHDDVETPLRWILKPADASAKPVVRNRRECRAGLV